MELAKEGVPLQTLSICVAVGIVVVTGIAIFLKGKKKPPPPFLTKAKQQVQLIERISLSHDTVLFRFALDHPNQSLGLPCGMHFKLFCPNPKGKVAGQWNGKEDPEGSLEEIERKYTPVTGDETLGHVDLIIKVYKGGVLDQFPDGGKMSQYLGNLKVGDTIAISGPWGLHTYKGNGDFRSGSKELHAKQLGMMAGGTGLTPMLRIIKTVLGNPSDPTKLSLLYANQSAGDILCREELDDLAAKHPDRFRVWYTVDRPDKDWKFDSGFITAEMIQKHQPPPSDDTLVLLCGPPPMVKYACKDNLSKLGYAASTILAF